MTGEPARLGKLKHNAAYFPILNGGFLRVARKPTGTGGLVNTARLQRIYLHITGSYIKTWRILPSVCCGFSNIHQYPQVVNPEFQLTFGASRH
jgi:hypothetical protein